MFCENFRLGVSVSEEVGELVKEYLVRKGVERGQAEDLVKEFGGDFREVARHCSVGVGGWGGEESESPAFDELRKNFKKPSLWEKNKEKKRRIMSKGDLDKGKSLTELYQLYKGISGREEISEVQKPEPKISDQDHQKIISIALSKNLSKEKAEFIAASSTDINEAIAAINSLTMYTSSIKGILKKPVNLGEVFLYTKGLNLTCVECTVCYEIFEIGDELLSLYCFHTFHKVCIDKWIRLSGGSKCPVCGQTLKDLVGLFN